MYQRRPPNLATSTADLSERDIKENPVVKEEETNETEVFEEVVVEVARLSKEPTSVSLLQKHLCERGLQRILGFNSR